MIQYLLPYDVPFQTKKNNISIDITYSFNIFFYYIRVYFSIFLCLLPPFLPPSSPPPTNSKNLGEQNIEYFFLVVEIKVFVSKRFLSYFFIRTISFQRSFNIFLYFLQNEIFPNLKSFCSVFGNFSFISTLFDPQFSPGTFVSIYVMAICKQWNRWKLLN